MILTVRKSWRKMEANGSEREEEGKYSFNIGPLENLK